MAAAAALGEAMASRQVGLVYGGGNTGLMGAVARGCASNGGDVHGILPRALTARERKVDDGKPNGLTVIPDSKEYGRTTLVDDMHTRKRMMGEESDAFITLPGGYGTLEELMEVTTWFQLLIHHKPIVLLNIDGFYDGLIKFIENAIESGFISPSNGKILLVANSVDEVFEKIENFSIPDGVYNLDWKST